MDRRRARRDRPRPRLGLRVRVRRALRPADLRAGLDWLPLLGLAVRRSGRCCAWAVAASSRRTRRAALRLLDRRPVGVAARPRRLYTGNAGTYYAGLETVPASLAGVIVYIYPAIVAVLSLRYGRGSQGRRPWIALGIALVGVVARARRHPTGDAAADQRPRCSILASPLIYAGWIVLSARLAGERTRTSVGESTVRRRRRRGRGHGADDDRDRRRVRRLAGLATGRPLAPARSRPRRGRAWSAIGFVATFLAIQTFYAGSRRIGAAQAALVSTVEPFYTITLAALLFGETLAPVQLVGGALIIIGVLIAQTPVEAFSSIRPGVRLADEYRRRRSTASRGPSRPASHPGAIRCAAYGPDRP